MNDIESNKIINNLNLKASMVEGLQDNIYRLETDCANLKEEIEVKETALRYGIKMISQLHEDCARLKALLADMRRELRSQIGIKFYEETYQELEARIRHEGIE